LRQSAQNAAKSAKSAQKCKNGKKPPQLLFHHKQLGPNFQLPYRNLVTLMTTHVKEKQLIGRMMRHRFFFVYGSKDYKRHRFFYNIHSPKFQAMLLYPSFKPSLQVRFRPAETFARHTPFFIRAKCSRLRLVTWKPNMITYITNATKRSRFDIRNLAKWVVLPTSIDAKVCA
jgi:hypothetical protein